MPLSFTAGNLYAEDIAAFSAEENALFIDKSCGANGRIRIGLPLRPALMGFQCIKMAVVGAKKDMIVAHNGGGINGAIGGISPHLAARASLNTIQMLIGRPNKNILIVHKRGAAPDTIGSRELPNKFPIVAVKRVQVVIVSPYEHHVARNGRFATNLIFTFELPDRLNLVGNGHHGGGRSHLGHGGSGSLGWGNG